MKMKITDYMKWQRGAVRWNNGVTMYRRKYLLRLIMNWAQDLKKGERVSLEEVYSRIDALEKET